MTNNDNDSKSNLNFKEDINFKFSSCKFAPISFFKHIRESFSENSSSENAEVKKYSCINQYLH